MAWILNVKIKRSHLQLSALTLLVPSYFAHVAQFHMYSIMLLATVATSQIWHGHGMLVTLDTCIANITGAYQILLFCTHGFYTPTAIAMVYIVLIFHCIRCESLAVHATIHVVSAIGSTMYVLNQSSLKLSQF